jgi:hypothetical protein
MKYSPINYTFEIMSDFIKDLTQDQFDKIIEGIEKDDALGRIEREHCDEFFEEFGARYTKHFEN